MAQADPDFALRRVLSMLGSAMVASGQAVDVVEDEIRALGRRYGSPDVQVGAGPTGVHVAVATGTPATFQSVAGNLRLDQAAEVRLIRHQLMTGEIGLDTATFRLAALRAKPPHYPGWLAAAGFVGVGVGICCILQPGLTNLVAAAIGSVVVHLLTRVVARRPTLGALLPTAAGFVVALLVLGAAELGFLDGALRTVLAPLAVLLPGALIVTGFSELAAGAMSAGSARLIYGTAQLLLFTVGIVAAAGVLRIDPGMLGNVRVDDIGWWGPPLGLLFIGLGIALMESVPLLLVPWVLGVLVLTFLAQLGGQAWGQPVLGSFLGAIAATLGSSAAELVDRRLPRQVVFLPSFWLLVPGSLGLLGVSEIAVGPSGVATAGADMPAVVLAIAVGLLAGAVIGRTLYRVGRSVRQVVRH